MAGLLSSLFGRSSVPIPLLLTHLASLPFPRSLHLLWFHYPNLWQKNQNY